MNAKALWISLLLWSVPVTAVASTAPKGGDAWAGFLDYAYVYSSAEPTALAARLDRYAAKSGIELRDYIREVIEAPARRGRDLGEAELRRQAIGYLLDYIATGHAESIELSVSAARSLEKKLDRMENRYWVHYIRAHEALHAGRSRDFVQEVMELWLDVVVELEAPYDTYKLLSLNRAPSAGFVAALPYVYENVARLVLIRAPQMGVRRGIDPLGGITLALSDGRVGSDPDTIPEAVSSRAYLDAVATRLAGPESDGRRLSFTLALFEAGLVHDRARTALATEGLSGATLEVTRVAVGGYERALGLAGTLQGQVAVYTRALRLVGELFAAQQRLGEEADLRIPFSIERAIDIYTALHREQESWGDHGYREHGREAYLAGMSGLWEEIQEASFNAAEYHLARGIAAGPDGDAELAEAAARYARYLSFFDGFARNLEGRIAPGGVPDSAYFAAHRAERGIADALLRHAGGNPSVAQLELAATHYQQALALHPLDPALWSDLAITLERQGREAEFLPLAKPMAEVVTRSQAVDAWIGREAENSAQLSALRSGFANDLTLMYLGFAERAGVTDLTDELAALSEERASLGAELEALQVERNQLAAVRGEALAAKLAPAVDPLPAVSAPAGLEPDPPEIAPTPAEATAAIAEVAERIAELEAVQARLDAQIDARSDALPLFAGALEAAPLTADLGTQRHHPVHALVRRLYREQQ